jgi:phosphate transport system substrate-binding protein
MNKNKENSRFIVTLWLILFAFIFLTTCRNKGTNNLPEGPTSGTIRIEADESFQPVIDSQITTFTTLYRNAHVTAAYKPEKEIISDFLNDSTDVIVTSWAPSEELKKQLLNSQVLTKTILVAYDALALILNQSNKDTLLTYENVKDIFTGKITNWKQINPESKLGNINIIFDNNKSGNIRYFRERFNLPEQLPSGFYAVNNNPEVINYVTKSPGAIGILSVNWISDKDDKASVEFSEKVNIAAVSAEYLDHNTFYKPVQGSIYDKSFPFVRKVNMVSRESFAGPGSGFIAWVAGELGQKIILKSGLVPATMPVRLVRISKK